MNSEENLSDIFDKEGIETYITCKIAFKISESYNVPISEIASYCDKKHIKIRTCQLGCFK